MQHAQHKPLSRAVRKFIMCTMIFILARLNYYDSSAKLCEATYARPHSFVKKNLSIHQFKFLYTLCGVLKAIKEEIFFMMDDDFFSQSKKLFMTRKSIQHGL